MRENLLVTWQLLFGFLEYRYIGFIIYKRNKKKRLFLLLYIYFEVTQLCFYFKILKRNQVHVQVSEIVMVKITSSLKQIVCVFTDLLYKL
jgi:hypothetical protein